MNLSDTAVHDCVLSILKAAADRDETVVVTNDGEFLRSLELEDSITNRARVFGQMVSAGTICRSRPWPEGTDEERPVTLWLPSQPTPLNVLAYRR